MYILAIETTGPRGSAALLDLNQDDYTPLTVKVTDEPMGHLKNLMALTDQLLAERGVSPSDISIVAASVGPGSYTGIRIGVTSARAIAQALNVHMIAVGSLDQFRLRCKGRPVAVIFNARRGQVYGAVFNGRGRDILAPGPYMLTDILEVTKDLENVIFFGDGVDAYSDQLTGYEAADEEIRYQTADLTAKAAERKLMSGAGSVLCRYDEMMPDYMRQTEAEQKLADGTLARLREAKMAKFRSK